jgi:hypothetical protein
MESLDHLMGAYFHQDWDLDGGTVNDTVNAFAVDSPARVESTVADIDEVLDRPLPEGGLRSLLESMGCAYYAGETDQDYRTWLLDIRESLSGRASST